MFTTESRATGPEGGNGHLLTGEPDWQNRAQRVELTARTEQVPCPVPGGQRYEPLRTHVLLARGGAPTRWYRKVCGSSFGFIPRSLRIVSTRFVSRRSCAPSARLVLEFPIPSWKSSSALTTHCVPPGQ